MQSSGDERFNCVMGDDKEDKGDEGVLSGWFIVPSRCSTMEDESGLTVGGESDTVIGDSAFNHGLVCLTVTLSWKRFIGFVDIFEYKFDIAIVTF